VLVAATGRPSASPPRALVELERYAMGTMFRVVATAGRSDVDRIRAAAAASLDEVVRLDHVLSHYDPESEVSRLRRQPRGATVPVSADLYDALERSTAMARLSGGRFDVTVGPIVRLWRRAQDTGRPPTDGEIADAARCVGPGAFSLEPAGRVRLETACLDLDLGGIGKGLAVDRAIAVLQRHGVHDAIVNAGGSTLRAIGSAPDGPGWPVQTAALRSGPLRLQHASISTSAPSPEVIVPHLRAPATASASTTVTVLAPDAATADALSTALLLSTLDDARAMLQDVPGASAWWTADDGVVVARLGRDFARAGSGEGAAR
jgi:FAD:protein FMN transferase